MHENCRNCMGTGCEVAWVRSDETGKKVARVTPCKTCDGDGKSHCCEFHWCREYRYQ